MATSFGEYELTERLGAGAMGEVWLGRHRGTGVEVALKRVVDRGREGWADPLAEVRAVAALDHPHIVRVLDFGRSADRVWIAMERAHGSLTESPPASWAELRVVLRSLLQALAHAHARGIVHLDVKPDNVLALRSGSGLRWLLADFGLAHLAGVLRPGDDAARGTPQYMAPEQFTADASRWGPWTDLYALGGVAVLLASGRPPFVDGSVQGLAQKHRFAEPPPLQPLFGVPPGFEGWCLRLLEKDPRDRFRLAADALQGLDALGDAVGEAAVEPVAQPGSWGADTFAFDALDGPADGEPGSPIARSVGRTVSMGEGEVLRARSVASPALLDVRALPLVGRQGEMAQLAAVLDGVVAARSPGWVRVAGPAGVGRRHLVHAFGTAAEESGRALRAGENLSQALQRADRALIVSVDGAAAGALERLNQALGSGRPVLVLVHGPALGVASAPLATLSLGPLAAEASARLARNLAPLDEGLVAELVAATGGHPGSIVGRVRTWTATGDLVPGDFGLVLAPPSDDRPDPRALLDALPADDPFAPLLWSIEEDPDASLDAILEEVEAAWDRGTPVRALLLITLVDRALARSVREHPELAWRAAALRSTALNALGHVEQAARAARKGVELARRRGDSEKLARSLLQEAHLVRHGGGDPMPLLEEAEATSSAPVVVARARGTRGSILIGQGRYAEARQALTSAIDHLLASEETTFLGNAWYWLGNAWAYDGELERAREAYRSGLAVFRADANQAGTAMSAMSVAEASLHLGDLDGAAAALDEAERATSETESPWMRVLWMGHAALLHEGRGDLARAEAVVREARSVRADTEMKAAMVDLRLARVLAVRGGLGAAGQVLAEVDGSALKGLDRTEYGAVWLLVGAPEDPEWLDSRDEVLAASLWTAPVRSVLERAVARHGEELAAVAERLAVGA